MAANPELISTRVNHDLAERLKDAAALARRPLSQFVRLLLADALDSPTGAHGRAAPPEGGPR